MLFVLTPNWKAWHHLIAPGGFSLHILFLKLHFRDRPSPLLEKVSFPDFVIIMTYNYSLLFYTLCSLLRHHTEYVLNGPQKQTEIHFTTFCWEHLWQLSSITVTSKLSVLICLQFETSAAAHPSARRLWIHTEDEIFNKNDLLRPKPSVTHIVLSSGISALQLSQSLLLFTDVLLICPAWKNQYIPGHFPLFLCIKTPCMFVCVCVLKGISVNLCMCPLSFCMPVSWWWCHFANHVLLYQQGR